MLGFRSHPCPHFLRDFSAFVDGELDDDRMLELRVHLDDCEPCLRHLAAYRRGLVIYRSGSDPDPSIDLYEQIRTRLEEDSRVGPVPVPVVSAPGPDLSPSTPWIGSSVGGVVTAVIVAFLFVLAVTPNGADLDSDGSSSPAVTSIPVVTPQIDLNATAFEPRAEIARVAVADARSQERSISSDASDWLIAEVERHDRRPHPLIVQAAFSLP